MLVQHLMDQEKGQQEREGQVEDRDFAAKHEKTHAA
jgi:hypothetical protein